MTAPRISYRTRAISIVAAVLSAFVPGLGQGFAGRPFRGLAVALALTAGAILAIISFLHMPSVVGLALPLVLLLGGRVWSVIDAARVASDDAEVRWVRRVIGFLLLLVAGVIVDAAGAGIRQRYFGSSFRLPSGSMEPTLLEGEYFITVPVKVGEVQRGDVVAFHWPDDSTNSFVRRVVGITGDTLAMRNGVLLRNGKSTLEPYAHHTDPNIDLSDEVFVWQKRYLAADLADTLSYRATRNNWGPLVVPPRALFVLGDNRDNSLDSRYRGFVPTSSVFARAYRVYFSRDISTGRIRWNRIGKILERNQPNTR